MKIAFAGRWYRWTFNGGVEYCRRDPFEIQRGRNHFFGTDKNLKNDV